MVFVPALLLIFSLSYGTEIYVAVASSMRPLFEELTHAFEKKYGRIKVKLSFGSSGNLYRQLSGGAPYDIFISADPLYVKKLMEEGKGFLYREFAVGKLILFSLHKNPSIKSLENSKRIAIASPRYAPYGKAAVIFLRRTDLYKKLRDRLVYGSNVAQAFQFAVMGGAEIAIVSLSLALSYGKGKYFIIPSDLYPPVKHVLMISVKGSKKKEVLKFFHFLREPEVKSLIKRHGFEAL